MPELQKLKVQFAVFLFVAVWVSVSLPEANVVRVYVFVMDVPDVCFCYMYVYAQNRYVDSISCYFLKKVHHNIHLKESAICSKRVEHKRAILSFPPCLII